MPSTLRALLAPARATAIATTIATALIAMFAAPQAAVAGPVNLVNNGSFEANAVANGSWGIYGNLTGWTGGAAGIELRNNVAGTALDGKQYVELDTTANSSITQNMATTLGQWYELTFAYSNRAGVAVGSNGLGWHFGAASGLAPQQAYLAGNHSWQQFTTRVQATGSSMALSFNATGTSDSLGSSLDNISVNAVPEPQGLALAALALTAAAFVTRRRPSGQRTAGR